MNEMKLSTKKEVLELYDESAEVYSTMMDSEMKLPVYSDTLSRLAERIKNISGDLIDLCCGSGHMLRMYHSDYDPGRRLIGIDISPKMIEISRKRLNTSAELYVGDMTDLSRIHSGKAAALINYFAVHHVSPSVLGRALKEWNRVLKSRGQLCIAAWEGEGNIDYGEHSDVIALKHSESNLKHAISMSGFQIDQSNVVYIEEMEMNAIYLEAGKTG